MSVRAVQSAIRDNNGNLSPVQIIPFTAAEQAKRDRIPTTVENNEAIIATLNQHFGSEVSEDTMVRNRMAADILMSIDNTLTKTTSLIQVRINYEAHLRTVRGL